MVSIINFSQRHGSHKSWHDTHILFLRSLFDIHSSSNSIILCSTFIQWNTIQYSGSLNTRHMIIVVITIAYKGCVSISWRRFLTACHCTYVQSTRYCYHLRPHDNVAISATPWTKSTSLKWTHYRLGFAKLMLVKGKCGRLVQRHRHF